MNTHPLLNNNPLKLGIFCMNTLSVVSKHPDVWKATWPEVVQAAQMADAMGLEAIVPVARWKGYLDSRPEHPTHAAFDTFTFAAALAQATRYSAIFATTHASIMHPLVVAKQSATIDHVSGGRFALNVVGGVNRREFEMFGIDLLDHDQRYVHLEEWLVILRRLWAEPEEFDIDNGWFTMKGAISRPQPLRKSIPIMNAGASSSGMAFAAKNSDMSLMTLKGPDPIGWAKQVADYKTMARDGYNRDVKVWTNLMITVRDTQAEAEDYLTAYAETYTDHEAVDSFADTIRIENKIPPGSDFAKHIKRGIAAGVGLPVVGTAAHVASVMTTLSKIGLDGTIMTFVDFIDGLKRFQSQVLPLLETQRLRDPFTPAATAT